VSAPCRSSILARIAGCSFAAAIPSPRCSPETDPAPRVVAHAAWVVPAADATPTCADVGDLRVCWRSPAGGDAVAVERSVPGFRPSALGFRCTGGGKSRRCVDRTSDAGKFRCEGPRCEQQHPRLPDDGEWECADFAGAVVCRGGEREAGTPPGAADAGFSCGPRRGAGAGTAARICVDLSPDFPDGSARGWRCRFVPQDGLRRVCERDPSAHTLTDPCDPSHPCVSGLACITARCVPAAPAPACWLDRDCDKGACRFGTCMENVP
jgi:hypothetical protein